MKEFLERYFKSLFGNAVTGRKAQLEAIAEDETKPENYQLANFIGKSSVEPVVVSTATAPGKKPWAQMTKAEKEAELNMLAAKSALRSSPPRR